MPLSRSLRGMTGVLLCAGRSACRRGMPRGTGQRDEVGGWVGALRQIDTLLERRCVIPESAGTFAVAFHRLWTSWAYDTVTMPREFASRVTANIMAIKGDQHRLVRVVEISDAGEKAEGPLPHPIRYYRMRLREKMGFFSIQWLEGNIDYLDLRRFNAFSEAREMARSAIGDLGTSL